MTGKHVDHGLGFRPLRTSCHEAYDAEGARHRGIRTHSGGVHVTDGVIITAKLRA